MKLFLTDNIKLLDSKTISYEPITSLQLMERATTYCFDWICNNIELNRKIAVFAGIGNNGGDALAIARMLCNIDKEVEVFFVLFSDKITDDCNENLKSIVNLKIPIIYINPKKDIITLNLHDTLIIDGIFGSGLSKPIDGWVAEVIKSINESNSEVISIDMPSGLFGEDNTNKGQIVKATHTLTLEQPKLSQLFAENSEFIGDLHIVPIGLHPQAKLEISTMFNYLQQSDIKLLIKSRSKFSHKGTFGHAYIFAGKYGMMGANVLATKAAYRTGCGLVTSHVPVKGVDIVQVSVPEALLSIDESDYILTSISDNINDYSAVLFGPGVGCKCNTVKAFKRLLEIVKVPLVIDADGLNIISDNKEMLDSLPINTILTPHPKEFERIFGKFDDPFKRVVFMQKECIDRQINIVYKGANTIIVTSKGECFFNSTGNSGLATGGSGDVLSGIIVSLLAQGYSCTETMQIGVWIHGLAADIAVGDLCEHSLMAHDVINYISKSITTTINENLTSNSIKKI